MVKASLLLHWNLSAAEYTSPRMPKKCVLHSCQGRPSKHLLKTKLPLRSHGLKKKCGWFSNAASAESILAKLCRASAVIKSCVCCSYDELPLRWSQKWVMSQPKERNAVSGSMENPKKQGWGTCFNDRLVSLTSCLFDSLAKWVPAQVAGRLDCFSSNVVLLCPHWGSWLTAKKKLSCGVPHWFWFKFCSVKYGNNLYNFRVTF